jgi:hypothetical protein
MGLAIEYFSISSGNPDDAWASKDRLARFLQDFCIRLALARLANKVQSAVTLFRLFLYEGSSQTGLWPPQMPAVNFSASDGPQVPGS